MPTTLRTMRQSCRTFVLNHVSRLPAVGSLICPRRLQRPPPRARNTILQTEAKIKGAVLEIKAPEKEKDNLHMMLKSGEDTLDVMLCPKSFSDRDGHHFLPKETRWW